MFLLHFLGVGSQKELSGKVIVLSVLTKATLLVREEIISWCDVSQALPRPLSVCSNGNIGKSRVSSTDRETAVMHVLAWITSHWHPFWED